MQARITEDQIRSLVEAFYAEVRRDSVLGPIFEERLSGRWESHLDRMCDFWSSVLLASRRYRGNPAAKHAGIEGATPEAYDRWMELFRSTAHRVLPRVIADDVVARSARMRVVLENYVAPAPVS